MSNTDKKSKTSSSSTTSSNSIVSMITPILYFIFCIYALYLAFKCNGGFLGFLAACCCPVIYVPYKLSTKC